MAEPLIPAISTPGARITRAMSLPTLHTSEIKCNSRSSSYPASPDFHHPIVCPDLPDDPRTWASAHVATYLTYCLRLYPPAIINDLSRFVRADTSLDGRRFLRLKADQLRYMGFNERWITLIMLGVKTLRRESLKGKILAKPIAEDPEPLYDDGREDDNDVIPVDAVYSHDGASETTDTNSSTAISSPGSEKDVHLAFDNRWFIRDEYDKLNEASQTPFSMLNCDDAKNDNAAIALPLSFQRLMQTVRDTSRVLLPEFVRPYYARGFAHGALVGGVFVWACCKVVVKRN